MNESVWMDATSSVSRNGSKRKHTDQHTHHLSKSSSKKGSTSSSSSSCNTCSNTNSNGQYTKNNKKMKAKHTNTLPTAHSPIITASNLPIASYRDVIVASVQKYLTTIIVGETGSGKSTQLPQYLSSMCNSVVCTQPRRVAAITIAQRVAAEQGCKVGDRVGYSVRFDDRTSKHTKIRYVTDGVLLRECMSDENLASYDCIILDEAHERSLQTDILMGILKRIQVKNKESDRCIRIVVMSATLQVNLFTEFFHSCNVIRIPGREYPVEISYLREAEKDYLDAALRQCTRVHREEAPGGVLVFLPGQDDIEALLALLEESLPDVVGNVKSLCNSSSSSAGSSSSSSTGSSSSNSVCGDGDGEGSTSSSSDDVGGLTVSIFRSSSHLHDFVLYPLYASMSPEDQLKAFLPPPTAARKFVLSTNIAETSVTIAGIKYVIDVGFVKMRMMHDSTGLEMLKIFPVSQSQALQRAGRAGREQPGKCFRLYTSLVYDSLDAVTLPEIQRVDIAQVILQLKSLRIVNPLEFDYLSPPSVSALRKGLELLTCLGALNRDGSLSAHGILMSRLPLDPTYSHLLLKSVDFGCTSEILTDSLYMQPHRADEKAHAHNAHRRFSSKDGDLPTLVNIYDAWIESKQDFQWCKKNYLSFRALKYAYSVRGQLVELCKGQSVDPTASCKPDRGPFLRCVAVGLALNIARRNIANLANSRSSRDGNGKGNKTSASFAASSTSPYISVRGNESVYIHPSSVLANNQNGKLPDCVAYTELLITSRTYMRCITAVDVDWLYEYLPQYYKRK